MFALLSITYSHYNLLVFLDSNVQLVNTRRTLSNCNLSCVLSFSVLETLSSYS